MSYNFYSIFCVHSFMQINNLLRIISATNCINIFVCTDSLVYTQKLISYTYNYPNVLAYIDSQYIRFLLIWIYISCLLYYYPNLSNPPTSFPTFLDIFLQIQHCERRLIPQNKSFHL